MDWLTKAKVNNLYKAKEEKEVLRKNLFNRRMLGNLLVRWCEGLRLISSD
ncbi:hypothetical protein [Texas Phoenix palm phytoplasma]|nr:hypothetical protein [Texas Phoenix palm phytoplasma]